MSDLYVFTASDKNAYEHFQKTIEQPVSAGQAEEYLSTDECQRLLRLHQGSPLYAWGAIPGPRNVNTWTGLGLDDYVMVYVKGVFVRLARVTIKTRNRDFATNTWGLDKKGQTWELMYFLKDMKVINYPVAIFNEDLEYEPDRVPQGFYRILQSRLAGFGGVEGFLEDCVIPTDEQPPAVDDDVSTFGEVPGVPEGSKFPNRIAVRNAGLHRHTVAGISGSATEGADAIVLAGGYEDDRDMGDTIIYTGEGGNQGRKQVADQTFTKGNRALAVNATKGLPVRVIRGHRNKSVHSPAEGYSYDGLFSVDSYSRVRGISGFQIFQFHLTKLEQVSVDPSPPAAPPVGTKTPPKTIVTVTRRIRDTKLTAWVKKIYAFKCQVCGVQLLGPAGAYAEGAHIRPIGAPHLGPDSADNILCLCPNHHVLFDLGSFTINNDYSLSGMQGTLTVIDGHPLNPAHLQYHRESCYIPSDNV